MDTKKEIRKQIQSMKKRLEPSYEESAMYALSERLFSMDEWKNTDCILTYISYNHEMGTRRLIEEAFREKKRVAAPKVEGSIMNFYFFESMNDLVKSEQGILEPVKNHTPIPKNALVIMPGVAFDCKKNRIGYGGGFYDKYLALHSHGKRIALAYDFQILSHVPHDSFDMKPDYIITETRTIY